MQKTHPLLLYLIFLGQCLNFNVFIHNQVPYYIQARDRGKLLAV